MAQDSLAIGVCRQRHLVMVPAHAGRCPALFHGSLSGNEPFLQPERLKWRSPGHRPGKRNPAGEASSDKGQHRHSQPVQGQRMTMGKKRIRNAHLPVAVYLFILDYPVGRYNVGSDQLEFVIASYCVFAFVFLHDRCTQYANAPQSQRTDAVMPSGDSNDVMKGASRS
jgi:hypothetical protein